MTMDSKSSICCRDSFHSRSACAYSSSSDILSESVVVGDDGSESSSSPFVEGALMMEGCEAAVEWSIKDPEAERSSDIAVSEGDLV